MLAVHCGQGNDISVRLIRFSDSAVCERFCVSDGGQMETGDMAVEMSESDVESDIEDLDQQLASAGLVEYIDSRFGGSPGDEEL